MRSVYHILARYLLEGRHSLRQGTYPMRKVTEGILSGEIRNPPAVWYLRATNIIRKKNYGIH